jgi:TolA-binding protein
MIAAGVLIIGLAAVVMKYTGQVDELAQVNEQLAQVRSKLNKIQLEQLTAKQTELEEQLTQATSQSEAARVPFSELIGSTTAISTFLKVAEDNGLEVTEITSPGSAEDTSGELDYRVVPLTAKVQGDTPNLVSFLLELDSSLVTGVIESVTAGENSTAEIRLVVYTHRGD